MKLAARGEQTMTGGVADQALIESVVREVIAQLRGTGCTPDTGKDRNGQLGVFRTVDDAVAAANEAYGELRRRSLAERGRVVAQIRRVVIEQSEELGRLEFEETGIGRLEHKIDKLRIIGERIPGIEFLRSEAASG